MTADPLPPVALLMDYLSDYQLHLLAGYHRALDRAGLVSTTFVGREVQPQAGRYSKANAVFDLVDPARHLGVILSTASMGNLIEDQPFTAFAKRYLPGPVLAVGRALPGIPSVVPDNGSGMRALMEHLIVGRGLRRFVFLRGTRGNSDSAAREAAVREVLAKHGLDLPDQRVLQGDFFGPKAASEVRLLLSATRDFDAVVCANDDMALGAMQALQEQGIRVPHDVAVVGFDDIEGARYASPGLTTVKQPIEELAETAVEVLLAGLRGEPFPGQVQLPSQLVLRESCGHAPGGTSEDTTQPAGALLSDAAFKELQQLLEQSVREPVRNQAFLRLWQDTLTRLLEEGHEQDVLHLLFQLEQQVQGVLEPALHWPLRNLCYQAASLLQQAREQRNRRLLAQNNHFTSQMELALTTHRELEPMLQDLIEYADMVQVHRYAVVLFEGFGPELAPFARVALSRGFGPDSGAPFPTHQLLPDSLLPELCRHHLVVAPLFVSEVHYGLLIYQRPLHANFNGDHFRYTISTGIYHVHQSQVHQDQTRKLADHVSRRTSELEHLTRQMQHAAVHDALTGLHNKALFVARLEQVLTRPSGQGNGVIFLDLDRFKGLNDTQGHSVGDRLLQEVARRLKATVSDLHASSTVARFGGDEFAVLLEDLAPAGVLQVARHIQQGFQLPLDLTGEGALYSSASIGVVLLGARHQHTEEVLRDADIAMYQAKRQGPGRIRVFEPSMHDHVSLRTRLETDLREALKARTLQVYYQPLVQLQSGTIAGFEALARWFHPELGFISPAEFIPIAEDAGLIVELDRQILQQACTQLQQWHRDHPGLDLHLSVNMSTRQFTEADLFDQVKCILEQTGFPARRLRLEITESLLAHRAEVVLENLQHLQELGVRLHIDDFGTGYSSLGYLQQFQASALKIDRSFIQNLPHSEQQQELVKTIIQLAHNLGMTVVAEGVEDEAQQGWLLGARCDLVQGFFYSRPVEGAQALQLLVQQLPLPD